MPKKMERDTSKGYPPKEGVNPPQPNGTNQTPLGGRINSSKK